MYPVLLEQFGIVVTTFGVCLAVSFFVFSLALMSYTKKNGLNMSMFTKHLFLLVFVAALGAKFTYWLFNIGQLWVDLAPNLMSARFVAAFKLLFNVEQFYVVGGLVPTFGLFFYFLHKQRENLYKWADAIMPSFLLAMIIAYLGAFWGGFYVGAETQNFWGVRYENVDIVYSLGASIAANIPVHPLGLYAAASSLLLFLIINGLKSRLRLPGLSAIIGTILFAIQSIVLFSFRNPHDEFANIVIDFRFLDPLAPVFSIPLNLIVSVGLIALAIYVFMFKLPRIGSNTLTE